MRFEDQGKNESKSVNGSDGNQRIAKVLIVESQAIIGEDLRVRLEEMGYEVTGVAISGQEAIDSAKQTPPDILFIDPDISGNDISGTETAVILQGYFRKLLPVVFITAYSEKEFPLLEALDSYVFLKKPFANEDLSQCLENAIAKKRDSKQ
jgi:CheY-like chemotaxis protein